MGYFLTIQVFISQTINTLHNDGSSEPLRCEIRLLIENDHLTLQFRSALQSILASISRYIFTYINFVYLVILPLIFGMNSTYVHIKYEHLKKLSSQCFK